MGMPDKVIAFDELPEDLLEGLEMLDQSKMPRHWRDFMGVREKLITIKPYVDPMTRQLVQCEPLIQKGPFAWVIDWEVNHDKERWQEISNFVRRNCPKDFRLLDSLEDMAKPLAPNPNSEITLEPEEVIVIPLPKNVEKEPEIMTISVAPPPPPAKEEIVTISVAPATVTIVAPTEEPKAQGIQVATPQEIVENKAVSAPNLEPKKAKNAPCEVCGKKFDDGRGRHFHMRKHAKQPIAA
jgi:hypothetical protein